MSGKVALMTFLLLVLLASCAASSSSSSSTEAGDSGVMQQLLASRRRSAGVGKALLAPQLPPASRAQRRAHLSDEERELVTKQIMQAISEIMNSDCMADRDYQGWLDFGRRDAE